VGERLVGPLDNVKELVVVGAEPGARSLLEMNSNQGEPPTRRVVDQGVVNSNIRMDGEWYQS
jgi:hypothetical protein